MIVMLPYSAIDRAWFYIKLNVFWMYYKYFLNSEPKDIPQEI